MQIQAYWDDDNSISRR